MAANTKALPARRIRSGITLPVYRAVRYHHHMGATRRAFLAALASSTLHAELEKGKNFPSEWKRYQDPATEFDVYRLTDPAFASYLPAHYNRALSRRPSDGQPCSVSRPRCWPDGHAAAGDRASAPGGGGVKSTLGTPLAILTGPPGNGVGAVV